MVLSMSHFLFFTGALIASLVLVLFVARMRGRSAALFAGTGCVLFSTAVWLSFPWLATRFAQSDRPLVSRGVDPHFATSESCIECHQGQFETWKQSFHRTMTRDATPEFVKGNFDNATVTYQGIVSRMTREGDGYFMETVDPQWAWRQAQTPQGLAGQTNPPMKKFKVERVVGSHWLQECLHLKENGEFQRLPIMYHLGEKRWVHSNGSFLSPDSEDFWSQSRGANWNESCLYCHNTGVAKNPVKGEKGNVVAYKSTVHELGISCEACHGPAGNHVDQQRAGATTDEPTDVVNPAKLSVARRDDVCARCHGALVPKIQNWDLQTHRDPFAPGQELRAFNHVFWSEKEQLLLATGKSVQGSLKPDSKDGRFWEDGTPLTTSLEYNAMALSGCYEKGLGKMSCLSCHGMHGADPNFQLKPKMNTNEACFQCHQEYRTKLAEHTRHGADSPGSQCVGCHMPKQVYSLMGAHRSHRIQIPDLASSLNSGKPHACNLCHLDQSLGWTQKELAKWPHGSKHAAGRLSTADSTMASSLVTMIQGDARSRVIFAAAFSEPAARKASGDDWYGVFLPRLMQIERYPAVRYLAKKALVAVHGEAQITWDTLARREQRTEELRLLLRRFDAKPVETRHPFLPLNAKGLPDEEAMKTLLRARRDPDVTVNE